MSKYPEPPRGEPTNKDQLMMLALLAVGSAIGGAVLAWPLWYLLNCLLLGLAYVVGTTPETLGYTSVWFYTSLSSFIGLALMMYGLQRR